MRLSRASIYALHGLALLAGASPYTPIPMSKIRRQLRVPRTHLAKIFQALVRVGVLRSSRGVGGGFSLARRAQAITALDVIQAVDGPLAEDDCPVHRSSSARGNCCAIANLIREGRRRMGDVLGRATLANLAGPEPVRSASKKPRP